MSTVTQVTNNVHQSKWGFHPCDRETYLKIKKLHGWFWKTVYAYAAWQRWNRKEPHNRCYWATRQSNAERRVRSDRPIPEPKYCPVFVRRPGWGVWNAMDDHGIRDLYEAARQPKATPEEVPTISVAAINSLYEKVRPYFEE